MSANGGLEGSSDVLWVKLTTSGSVPDNILICGKNNDQEVYVGRVHHENGIIIGTVIQHTKTCCISINGEVEEIKDFEVMTIPVKGSVLWEKKDLDSPRVIAGKLKNGQVVYVGRVMDGEDTFIGWVDSGLNLLHIPQKGMERVCANFEILVKQLPSVDKKI